MADILDVTTAIELAVSLALYPNGPSSPSSINAGAINARVIIGWPLPPQLDDDMAAGIVQVSIFAQPGLEKNTTRYQRDWRDQFPGTPTITATVSGVDVTIGGAVTIGNYVAIQVGRFSFSYAALAGDTLSSIAAALTALINVKFSASSSGAVITLPATASGRIVARVGAPGTSFVELERTDQRFQVTIWAPNNAARVAVARIIRPALAAIDFLALADGTSGWIRYENSTDSDRTAKQNVSRRDIFYWVEYPTMLVATTYPITTVSTGIEMDPPGTVIAPLPLASFTPAVTTIDQQE